MKTKLRMAVGIGIGTAIYEAAQHGISGADWLRPVFVCVVSMVLLAALPRRWFERAKSSSEQHSI